VVKISAWQSDYTEGSRQTQAILGSGVIIDQEGHILTNAHVINEHTDRIIITLFNLEKCQSAQSRLGSLDGFSGVANRYGGTQTKGFEVSRMLYSVIRQHCTRETLSMLWVRRMGLRVL